ncbi:hypothetical protein D8674_024315 [Pyrus ussuriensis x Pyrus communis]|uniref:Uncharacterized protein n=1 Tax=Pyrus ussuriensis x Pyrus communis TaxID=2448454 RepID=A0A5N5H6A1_9ROSA|nr:hypothetical protein D8674_024315 [Pyrus ussuriensis x Pyrus communis]
MMSMSSKLSSLDVLAVAALASSEEAESKCGFPEFPEADFKESHEIQTTVGSSSTIQEEKLRQIKILLRRMIREKTAELKARWGNPENMQIVVYQPPQHADFMNMAANIHPEVAQVQEKPARSLTTVLIGDDIVSFELPEDFSEDLKTLIPDGPPRRFSFSERLDGWRISRRRRSDGGKDMDERETRSAPRKRKASDVGCSSNDISEENMQGDADSHSGPSLHVGGGVEAGATATTEIFRDLTGDMELSELINQRECPKLEDVGITPIRPLS